MIYTNKNRVITRVWAAFAAFALILSAFPAPFFVAEAIGPAGPPVRWANDPKVEICHATASDSNPYTNPTVDGSSIINLPNGHHTHDDKGLDDKGDIIPSFDYDPGTGTTTYPGKNWTTDYGGFTGEDIWNNGCKVTGSISGTKYDDTDNDASIKSDTGIKDWTIRLYEVDTPWVLVGTQTTDDNGEFWFTDLQPGFYKVCEVMQDNWTQTFISNGSTNESPNVSEEGPLCQTVNIDKAGETNTVNFGNHYEAPAMGTVIIEKLTPVEGENTDFDFTGDLGAFSLSGNTSDSFDVAPGTYSISEVVPDNWVLASLSCDVDDEVVVDNQVTIELEADETITCQFGNRPIPQEPQQCKIGDNLLSNGSFEEPVINSAWSISAITDWVITKVSNGDPTQGEIWRGLGIGAFDGEQNLEMGANEATQITQNVVTIPGATYELSFAFAARSANSADNNIDALQDGNLVVNANSDTTEWVGYGGQFVADDASTDISFKDVGTDNSTGSLLDDTVLCLVKEPEEPCEDELDGSWADAVESATQGDTKANGAITDVNRTDPTAALGEEDWDSGDATGFFSLGFGGELVLSFDSYVPDVPGADIFVYEATNGSTYPEESATVEVSQNGTDWEVAGTISNLDNTTTRVSEVDFSGTSFDWITYVKITDTTNPAPHNNAADGYDVDAVKVAQQVCDEPEPEPETSKIIAHKLVCTDESDLPNWGAGGPNITEALVAEWLEDDTDSCEPEEDWYFQWGSKSAFDPGDDLIGEALEPWNTFGPTDTDGMAMVTLSEKDINGDSHVWFREVLQDGYINFTHEFATPKNSDDFTAEMYCHTDVKNYDNYDRIDGVELDETYYCIAWNVAEEKLSCEPDTNLIANGSFEEPIVTDGAGWDIFEDGAAGLAWAVEWADNFLGAPAKGWLELHAGVNGWDSSDGEQHAELDSDWEGPGGGSGEEASVAISQTIKTIPGETYTLSWDFSPRPNTNESENDLLVSIDGNAVVNNEAAGGGDVDWQSFEYSFEATTDETTVTFTDDGEPNSVGTFLDNVALVCAPETESPYCGDGEVNQAWEQCDSEDGCEEYCLWENQCHDEQLVKITLDTQAPASHSFDGAIHLGAAGNTIPSGTWFKFDEAGDATVQSIASTDGVEGLAVERTGTELRLAVLGDNASKVFDYVFGDIEVLGLTMGDTDKNTVPPWKLETSGAHKDVFDVTNNELRFEWYLTTGNDAAALELTPSGEYGICEEPERLSCEIKSSENPVNSGSSFTLTWETTGADHVEISNIGTDLDLDGSTSTSLTDTTTYVLTATKFSDEDQGEFIECEVTVEKNTGGGGGGSNRGGGGGSNNNDDEDDEETFQPAVLGEQVSIVPAGAPNAGAGGTSTGFGFFGLLALALGFFGIRFARNAN